MFPGKTAVLDDVNSILERGGFETLVYENSCFDIIAKKSEKTGSMMIFLKALLNIDSIQEEHSKYMKIISSATGSFCGLVGTHTRYEKMSDEMVYERFGMAAFTPGLLEKMVIYHQFPFVFRDRGGFYVEIDHKKMRSAREDSGMTQEALAKKMGISKKNVYEHEKSDMRMLLPHARKANKVLDRNIFCSFHMGTRKTPEETGMPKTAVEKEVFSCFSKIGLNASCVQKAPFNVIAKENIPIFAHAEKKLPVKRVADELRGLSKLSKSPVFVVAEEECRELPSIKRRKLKKIGNRDDLMDILGKF